MKESAMLHFVEDEVILRQGSKARVMYKILSGTVAVYVNHGQSDEYLLGILSEQRCFGEISVLCGKPSIYTVVAFTDVLVMQITEGSFDDFVKNNTKNAIDLMKNLANSIVAMNMNLTLLTEELTAAIGTKSDPQKVEDITFKIRQYAARDSISKALFSTLV